MKVGALTIDKTLKTTLTWYLPFHEKEIFKIYEIYDKRTHNVFQLIMCM